MKIGSLTLDSGSPCRIVAELGTSHNGSLDRAFRLVDAAAEAGADAVKLQFVIADEILHPLTGEVELPGGKVHLYERFKTLEKPPEFYREIKTYAESNGLLFLCTPFGIESARILKSLGCPVLKIASPELNHVPLLRKAASYGLPLILSTGVSTLGDIERALRITGRNVVLLHCVTAYPAPEEEYNLRLIPNLRNIFFVSVGLSDHSRDPVLVPAAAAALGASLVEKHFTLSRNGDGLDDPIALLPEEFHRMVEAIRRAERMEWNELSAWLEDEYGKVRLEEVLGTGSKVLAPSERDSYGRTNRSIHALRNLEADEKLSRENIAVLRTEKNLEAGLEPAFWDKVLGKRTCRSVPSGKGIAWGDLLHE